MFFGKNFGRGFVVFRLREEYSIIISWSTEDWKLSEKFGKYTVKKYTTIYSSIEHIFYGVLIVTTKLWCICIKYRPLIVRILTSCEKYCQQTYSKWITSKVTCLLYVLTCEKRLLQRKKNQWRCLRVRLCNQWNWIVYDDGMRRWLCTKGDSWWFGSYLSYVYDSEGLCCFQSFGPLRYFHELDFKGFKGFTNCYNTVKSVQIWKITKFDLNSLNLCLNLTFSLVF